MFPLVLAANPVSIAVIGAGGALIGTALTTGASVVSSWLNARRDRDATSDERQHLALRELGDAALEFLAAGAQAQAGAPGSPAVAERIRHCRHAFQLATTRVADLRVRDAADRWLVHFERSERGDEVSAVARDRAWNFFLNALEQSATGLAPRADAHVVLGRRRRGGRPPGGSP